MKSPDASPGRDANPHAHIRAGAWRVSILDLRPSDRDVKFSSLEDEEFPMTLQVGFVGTDGIVLASDTKYGETRDGAGIRRTKNRTKILMDTDRRIVVSSARNMNVSEKVARTLIDEINAEEWSSPEWRIKTIAEKAMQSMPIYARDVNCLVVSPSRRVFELFTRRQDNGADEAECEAAMDKAVAGDTFHPALFWMERYYQPRQRLRVLVPLAAHVINVANKISPDKIEGLEIVVCDDSGIRRLSPDYIRGLQSMSDGLDEHCRSTLADCPAPFTYSTDAL
jgi:20S proteasome alpha/beta subunit